MQPDFLGGNLAGVTDSLSHIRNLGCDTVWLSPFYETTAYHGYHITDFFTIDDRFGSEEDLKTLIAEAHALGLRVIADFVPNHCHKEHSFFKQALSDPQSPYRNWFYFRHWPNDYLCFLGYEDLPKINLDYPPAQEYLIQAAKHWLSFGLDGFRLDHVIGPSHDFWTAFRSQIKQSHPEAVLIGEAWLTGTALKHLNTLGLHAKWLKRLFDRTEAMYKAYIGQLDGVLDFWFQKTVIDCINRGAHDELERRLTKHYARFPDDFFLVSFLDNHDIDRALFQLGNDKEKLMQAACVQARVAQPMVIYYGTEAGMTHRQSGFGKPHGDLLARQPMPWDRQDDALKRFYSNLLHS